MSMNDDVQKKSHGVGNQTGVLRVIMGGKSDRNWRDRLRDYVAEAKKNKDSPRQISIRAAKIRAEKGIKPIKKSEGYVWSLIEPNSTIDPPLSHLESVAEAMGLRLVQLLEEGAESPIDYTIRQRLKRAPEHLKALIEKALEEEADPPE